MAFKLLDWIKDTTTTAGTADFELAGAFATFRSFSDVLVDGDTTHYTAYIDGHRESGLGTYDATAGVLVRTAVYDSTNGGAKVSFPAGTKVIECSPIGNRMLTLDGPGKPGFLANKAGVDQAKDVNTLTVKVTFTNEAFDEGGFYDAVESKWTPAAGKYRISAQVGVKIGASGRTVYAILYKNGSPHRYSPGNATTVASVDLYDHLSAEVEANGTDYFEIYITTAQGGGLTVLPGDVQRVWFSGSAL